MPTSNKSSLPAFVLVAKWYFRQVSLSVIAAAFSLLKKNPIALLNLFSRLSRLALEKINLVYKVKGYLFIL